METFSVSLAIYVRNSPVTGEFPAQRPVTRSFDVFFDLHLNKRLSKQSWNWWFEMPSRPLWRHSNAQTLFHLMPYISVPSATAFPAQENYVCVFISHILRLNQIYIRNFIFDVLMCFNYQRVCMDCKQILPLRSFHSNLVESCFPYYVWFSSSIILFNPTGVRSLGIRGPTLITAVPTGFSLPILLITSHLIR